MDAIDVLVALFLTVFGAWAMFPAGFMNQHFALSRPNLFVGRRVHTVITVSISHVDAVHLGLNLATLLSVGREVLSQVGPGQFWLLWAISGLAGSFASLYAHPSHYQAVGASGALYGLSGYLAASADSGYRVLCFGHVVTPAQSIVMNCAAAAALEGAGIHGGTDKWMHLGGAAGGAFIFPLMQGLIAQY